jgi:hypothetical protein
MSTQVHTETEETRDEAHVMFCLDKTGDTRLIWDADNREEVANARRTFEDLTKKGFWAYSTDKKGERSERIREFDANAERIILAPQVRGG